MSESPASVAPLPSKDGARVPALVAEARARLEDCRKKLRRGGRTPAREQVALYGGLQDALRIFSLAAELEPENADATEGVVEAWRSLARAALQSGDLYLAESSLAELDPSEPKVAELFARLERARAARLATRRRAHNARRSLVMAIALLALGCAAITYWSALVSVEAVDHQINRTGLTALEALAETVDPFWTPPAGVTRPRWEKSGAYLQRQRAVEAELQAVVKSSAMIENVIVLEGPKLFLASGQDTYRYKVRDAQALVSPFPGVAIVEVECAIGARRPVRLRKLSRPLPGGPRTLEVWIRTDAIAAAKGRVAWTLAGIAVGVLLVLGALGATLWHFRQRLEE